MPALTSEQLKEIADAIIDTSKNVYRHVERHYDGHEFTEEEWDRMCKQEGIFRCVECSLWLGNAFKAAEDLCVECG